MLVHDRMTKSPITISPRDTAERAIVLMDAAGVDHLPVCEGKRLVGLLARRELLERTEKLFGRHPSPQEVEGFLPFVHVAGIMALEPPRVLPESTITDAVDLMRASGLTAVPVVDDSELVGILTARDLSPWLGVADRPGTSLR